MPWSEWEVLAAASRKIHHDIDVCCFPVIFGNDHRQQLVSPRSLGFRLNFKGINHQGALIRRSLFERIGVYDNSFAIKMYGFFLRAYRAGARFERSSAPVLSFMRDGEISSQSDWPSLQKRFGEKRRATENFVLHSRAGTGSLPTDAFGISINVPCNTRRLAK